MIAIVRGGRRGVPAIGRRSRGVADLDVTIPGRRSGRIVEGEGGDVTAIRGAADPDVEVARAWIVEGEGAGRDGDQGARQTPTSR